MKKLLSFIVSTAITMTAVSVICSAQGETGAIAAGWEADCIGDVDLTQCGCALTDEESYDGGHSIKLIRTQPDNGSLYNLRNRCIEGLPAGSYDIEMYLKGDEADINRLYVELDGGGFGVDTYWFSEKTQLENGWWRFRHTAKTSSAVSNIYFKQFNSLSAPVYIDCVSLKKSGENVNYLVNGDFEWDFNKNNDNTLPTGWFQTASNTENVYGYCTITNEDSMDGKSSLKIMNADFTNNDNKQIYLRNSTVLGNEAGKYILTMYVKSEQTLYISLNLDGADSSYNLQYPGNYTSEDAGNGWKKITAEYNTTGALTQFNMCIFGKAGGILIDKISLCKDGTGENILLGGSFEANNEDRYTNEYYPTGVSMRTNGGSANIAWKNPASNTLTGVRVYNVTNGETEVSSGILSGSGVQNSIDISAGGGIELYKLEFNFSDRESTYYLVSGNTARTTENTGAGGGDLNVSAKAMDNALEISWIKNSKSKGCKSVFLYKTENGRQIRFAELYANMNDVIIPNLTNGVEYEYIVRAGYGYGLESDGVTVKGIPRAAEERINPTQFKDLIFTNRGFSLLDSDMNVKTAPLTSVTEGYVSSSIYVKNKGTVPRSICKITALYKNGILIDAACINKSVEPTAENMPGEEFATVMYVPAAESGSDYRISEFIWESINSQYPLTEVSRLE